MTTNATTLYRGQAACLVLSLPPTDKNREKAKEILDNSQFDVTYVRGSDSFLPVAIGKKTKELNPFLYLSYPPTPTQLNTPPLPEESDLMLEESSEKQTLPEKLPSIEKSISEEALPTQKTLAEQTPEDLGVLRSPKGDKGYR